MVDRTAIRRWCQRRLGYPLEAAGVAVLFMLFKALTLDRASALGGWIGRHVGPWLPPAATARHNLRRAMPELDHDERDRILSAMWDNLGRTMAEYPHLRQICRERVEVIGWDQLRGLVETPRTTLLFSGHFANWEALPMVADQRGLALASIYRRPNNPIVDRLLQGCRQTETGHLFAKGRDGARQILATLRKGGTVAMLVDQKLNDGLAVPFFGRPAMTAPAIGQMAHLFHCPVLPARIERLAGARFRITIGDPVTFPETGNRAADLLAAMTLVNGTLEHWIRERPAQWLWIHRRWPD
ncbi:MAG: lauroyl acyltransferase [Azospirillaceae bacterium]|nr:lauroyl acyltransferase [Azospirillaceae bacterium]